MTSHDHRASNWLPGVSIAPSLAASEDAAGLFVCRVVQKTRRDVLRASRSETGATKLNSPLPELTYPNSPLETGIVRLEGEIQPPSFPRKHGLIS